MHQVAAGFGACSLAVIPIAAHGKPIDLSIAPFAWGPSLKGQLSQGPIIIPLDASVGDLAGGVRGGGMLHGEATGERFQASVQVIYVDFHDHSFAPVLGAEVRSKLLTVEALAGPRFTVRKVEVVPMVGLRYSNINGAFAAPGLGTLKAGKQWSEALVGLELRTRVSQRLTLRARATTAIAGPDGQSSFDLIAAGSYRVAKGVSLALGYRWAKEKVLPSMSSSFGMDLKADGPVVGLVFGL